MADEEVRYGIRPDARDVDGNPVTVGFGGESMIVYVKGELGMQWAMHLMSDEAVKLAERILQGCDERGWVQ